MKNENIDFLEFEIAKLYNKKNTLNISKRFLEDIKKYYVYNENIVEDVKEEEIKQGLEVVFDYIKNNEWKNMENIYLILKLHSLLYSKVPYKKFGGSFRNSNTFISNSDIKTTEPSDISYEIHKLTEEFDDIIRLANNVKSKKEDVTVVDYIKRIINIKCRLIQIHPFTDGNGRTCRALVNLLLYKIGIPPVYIEAIEKESYINAMDKAITVGDKTTIDSLYYKKIIKNLKNVEKTK